MSNTTAQAPITETEDQAPSLSSDGSSQQPAIEAEMLIEEISIDGMCGVY